MLRAIGLTLARAVPTTFELARGPQPRLRAPLMRHPPSMRGKDSSQVELKTDEKLRAERARLERQLKGKHVATPGAGEGEDFMHPGLVLL